MGRLPSLANTCIVHVRHTDMIGNDKNGGGSNDKEVLAWVKKTPGPIFMATDNPGSAELLRKSFPGRIVGNDRFLNSSDKRKTTLAEAVATMWVASYAVNYMGTAGSTYSGHIADMGKARGTMKRVRFCSNTRKCYDEL